MSMRIHTTSVGALAVETMDDDRQAEVMHDLYGFDVAIEQDIAAMVIEDAGNQEAVVIYGDRNDLRDFALRVYDSTCETLWDNDVIQFARLLSEIKATFSEIDVPGLCASMDLDPDDIDTLFERADKMFELAKAQIRQA